MKFGDEFFDNSCKSLQLSANKVLSLFANKSVARAERVFWCIIEAEQILQDCKIKILKDLDV